MIFDKLTMELAAGAGASAGKEKCGIIRAKEGIRR